MRCVKMSVMAVLALLPLITKGETPVATDGGAPEGLKVYQADSILRNGDFKQRALNRNAPAHWNLTLDHWAELPGEMNLYSLTDGTLRVQSPAPGVVQFLDVTPVTALDYILSFEAEVEAGILECSVKGSKNWLSVQIKEGKGIERHSFPFKLDSGVSTDEWRVEFRPQGKDVVFKLRNVVLKPALPESKADAKALYIDDAGRNTPLRGIAVTDNNSVFEHFYDLKAAQYLRKYLYVSFGRVIPIYTGSKEAIEKEKGMVCFGKSLVDAAEMAKVTAGGYALNAKGGNIYVGGKDDGAVHGAFSLLSGMGMEFFGTLKDFTLATGDVIKLAKPTMICNPSFAVRTSIWPILSAAPLGESCAELMASGRYIGQWVTTEHTNGILVDPFIYFKDHPEYYALNKDGKRSWQGGQLASQHGLKSSENMTRNDAATFRCTMNLCWSNPEVQKIATETVLSWFELVPETKAITVLQGDGSDPSDWCRCENCRNFGVSCTDRYLRFVNIIAKAVKGKYPDKLILAWAYCVSFDPPVKVLPDSNVNTYLAVCGVGWGQNGSPTETRILASSCMRGVNGVAKWISTGVPVGCALYFPSFYEAVDKMRFFGAEGATALFHVFSVRDDYLTNYIMRKLAWDLAMDVGPSVDRFMDFYYGSAASDMRQYFNLVEEKKLAFANGIGQGNLGSDYIPFVVDYETLVQGGEYLDRAEALVKRDDGRRMIRQQKLQFLNSYLMRNKSALLQDAELERFAKCLSEALKLAKELNDKAPKHGMTYREMVSVATSIDIGDAQPWHKSAAVQKIVADPLEMVKANKKEGYDKTEKGLSFDLKACAGGDELLNYQNEGMPKTKRPFAKVLRRASSPKSTISAAFTLSGMPEQGASLDLVGLDDEKTGRAALKVLVNGESVFEGENTFGENDWTQVKIQIPAKVLKKGVNTLEIKNTTPEKIAAVADIYGAKDYSWGWFMIAEADIVFAPGNNPVVEKAPLVLDAWKKARIDVFDATKKKLAVRGDWGGGSDVYVWGESKTLSDKWEDWTVSVVPEEDCNLTIRLGGSHRPKEKGSKILVPIWAEYDDLKIEGAALINPGFETLNDKGLPAGWECVPANVVTDASAAEGKTYVKAWFSQPVVQVVSAKAGQAVTITVKVRRTRSEPDK
ncbi:MAG: DUF4838 domain-containing protein [Victivallales bacterium]